LLHKSITKTIGPNNNGSGTSWLVALPKIKNKNKIPPFSFQSTKCHLGSIPKGMMNKNQNINTTFKFKVFVNSRNKWSLMLIATPTSNCNTLSCKTIFQWKSKRKSKVTPSYKLHLSCCKKTHVQTIGIQVQNTQNNHMFFLCASEFQRDERWYSQTTPWG